MDKLHISQHIFDTVWRWDRSHRIGFCGYASTKPQHLIEIGLDGDMVYTASNIEEELDIFCKECYKQYEAASILESLANDQID